MKLNFDFNIGDVVYLKTDRDQYERIITEIWVRPGQILYYLMESTLGSWHYPFEISKEKDIIKMTSN